MCLSAALLSASLLLAGCGSNLPLPGGSRDGLSTAPTPQPQITVNGKHLQVGETTYWGGGDLTFTVDSLPDGAAVAWQISRGELTPQEGGTAILAASGTNTQVLTGTPVTVTARVSRGSAVTPLTLTLNVDDAPPRAEGGVSLKLPGGQTALLTSGMELGRGVTFHANFADDGVGMDPVVLAAWRDSLPVRDGLTSTEELPEASEYSLHGSSLQDRLGNRIEGNGAVLGGPFGTDYAAPTLTADRPSGAALAGVVTNQDGSTTEDALTFVASDPARADSTPGSGVSVLTVTPAGTVTGSGVTVTQKQLRTAGVTGSSVTVTVTATDAAGNARMLEQQVKLQ